MDIFSETTIRPGETDGTYDVRLSLSLTGAVAVTVLDFFRDRPILRFATGLLGIPLVLGGVWALINIGFDWWDIVVYGALLTGAAVFSSTIFNVYMAAEDDDPPGEELNEVGTVAKEARSPLDVAVQESLEGQAASQREAWGRFRWGLLSLLLGAAMCGTSVMTLLGARDAIWWPYFWLNVGLGSVLVAGVLLYSSAKAQMRSALFGSQLMRLRDLQVAISLADTQTGENAKASSRDRIIDVLLRSGPGEVADANTLLSSSSLVALE